jgi:hypothetical protein
MSSFKSKRKKFERTSSETNTLVRNNETGPFGLFVDDGLDGVIIQCGVCWHEYADPSEPGEPAICPECGEESFYHLSFSW